MYADPDDTAAEPVIEVASAGRHDTVHDPEFKLALPVPVILLIDQPANVRA